MHAPRRLVAVLVSAVAALVVLGACGSGAGDDGSHEAAGRQWRGTVLDRPVPVPDVTLTGTDGQPYELRSRSAGKLTLLFFGYTHCPDACPLQMATIAAALEGQSARVRTATDVVFVTTDPARDTPERLRTWLDGFNTRFVGLTGSPADLVAAQEAAGVPLSGAEPADDDGAYVVGHATQVLAFTPDGVARLAYPAGIRQADWRHDLPQLFDVPEWQVAT